MMTSISKSDDMHLTAISVIGLGKLGLPLAAAVASKGYRVAAVDSDPHVVQLINRGQSPIFEPGLNELLQQSRELLRATTDAEEAVLETEATFIVVPTPSDEHGGFSLRHVEKACESIANALRQKDDFHIVALTSTVMPGATGNVIKPLLEKLTGKRCGVDFGLCYSPEFIALGTVIRDFLNPDFVLIGESDDRSGAYLEGLYNRVCENDPPVARMNLVNAELTKLAVNSFVTTKISFANMLARICERLPEGNADVVTNALGLDSRIGNKYLKGAIGYGGPCFPRDNKALVSCALSLGASASLAEATDNFNREEVRWLADLVRSQLPDKGRVGILGLSYKPNTDVVDESQGILLAKALAGSGVPVIAYDPAGLSNARANLNNQVAYAASALDCVQGADVVVVTTAWDEFRELDAAHFERPGHPRVLIDCWRIFECREFSAGVEYLALGKGELSQKRSDGKGKIC
jgi:UDPglucose 6-dehydrogenase